MSPIASSFTEVRPSIALRIAHVACVGSLYGSNGRDAIIGVSTPVKTGDLITILAGSSQSTRAFTGVAHSIVHGEHFAKCGVTFREFVPELFRAMGTPGCARRVRFTCCRSGIIKQSLDRLKMPATALDYSRRGVALETFRPFREGEHIQFEFHDREATTRSLEMIVRWSKFNGRIHRLGCELPLGSKGDYPMAEIDVEMAIASISL